MRANLITFAVTIAACLMVAYAISDPVEKLKNMEKSSFGRRLLDMMQVQMNTGADPVKTLIDLLEKLKAELNEETGKLESMYQSQSSDCKTTLPQLKGEIRQAAQKSVYAGNRQDAKQEELTGLTLQLNENQKVLDKVVEHKKNILDQRDADRKKYEDAVGDIARIREALKKVKEILSSDSAGSSSFLEVGDTFKHLTFTYDYANGMHQMAMHFIEMAKADPKLMQHLFSVIDKINDQLSQNEFTLTAAESTKAKLFESQESQLSALEFEATAKVNDVKARQQALENELNTIKNDLAHYQRTQDQKKKELVDKTAQCKAADNNYKSRNKDLADQLELIEQAQILIKENVAPVKDYVNNRSTA